MNKRQKKKQELKLQVNQHNETIRRLSKGIMSNRNNIIHLLESQVYMELESEEKIKKLKEENSILIEEQEKQSKRITGVYIMILVVILLEVVQWWILHA